MNFYIATGIERLNEMRELKELLEKLGHTCTYDWSAHGSVQDQGDERYLEVAINEANGVMAADLVIVLLPGGRGTHSELGMAVGTNKDIVTIGTTKDHLGRDCVFYWHPRVIKRFQVPAEFVGWIRGVFEWPRYEWAPQSRAFAR